MKRYCRVVLPSICIAASVMFGGCIGAEPGDDAESMMEAEPGDGVESTKAEPTGATVSIPSGDAASNCTYYSGGTHSTIVGQYGYDCCNNKVAWGVKSRYAVCGGCFVCTPPPVE